MERIHLTKREYDVIIRLSKTNAEIASELDISEETIKSYYYHLSRKLNAHTRTEVVLKAIKYGIVSIYNFRL